MKVLALMALSACAAGFCGEEKVDVKKATLKDLAFLAGSWQGSMGRSIIEEQWSAPAGNNMIGMFRMVKNGKGGMYEINIIEQTENGPILRIRHFGAGLTTRDETPELMKFTLIELTKDKAIFEATDKHAKLTYHKASAEDLTITLTEGGMPIPFKFKLMK